MLFFAATINYMDRQVIGLLKPMLQAELGWTEIGYSNIVLAFQFAYAIGLLGVGKLIDRLGSRRGYSLAVLVWSAAAMAHAAARSVIQFAVARFALGIGESGNFPASVKTVAEWFPKRERALATGLFNSGANVGAMVTPLVIPVLTYRFGWRLAFIATGALGLMWVVLWLALYRRPEEDGQLSGAELAHIRSDAEEKITTVPWSSIVTYRQAWAIALGRFCTDPIWYVYLFWMPDFLSRSKGLSLSGMALPLLVIYNGATIGSIGGGWISGAFLKGGWSLNASRKTALLICAIAVVPVILASRSGSLWLSVALIAIAAGAHQGWSANMYTLASDMFPKSAVGSVVGFASMVGSVGAMFAAKAVGYILQWTGSYVPVFVMAGTAYLVAFGIVQLLAPTVEPVTIEASSDY